MVAGRGVAGPLAVNGGKTAKAAIKPSADARGRSRMNMGLAECYRTLGASASW